MENPNKNQDLNKQNQNVRPGQATPETKDFSKNREGQYSNDSSRSGSGPEINRGQNQNQKRDENLRQ